MRRWTEARVLKAIRGYRHRLGRKPTAQDMGWAIANAAKRHCCSISNAFRMLGWQPNKPGAKHKPKPRLDDTGGVSILTDAERKALDHEREQWHERERRRRAKEPDHIRRHSRRHGRNDFGSKFDADRLAGEPDYLPPPDLTRTSAWRRK